MGAERKSQRYMIKESVPSSLNLVSSSASVSNLAKSHLGGVIFGCKSSTIKECLSKQLFGLPTQHFSYVKNIDSGLPLFLFNYTDRRLHGIFEAASTGQMNINPYGWTTDGSDRTLYPAQVQIRVRMHCQPLLESQFKPIITDNYYSQKHFWFELDHAQTSRLMSLLASLAVAPSTSVPRNTAKWRSIFQPFPRNDAGEEGEGFKPLAFGTDHSNHSSQKSNSTEVTSLDGHNQILKDHLDTKLVKQNEKEVIYMKLRQLALRQEPQELPMSGYVEDTAVMDGIQGEPTGVEEQSEENPDSSSGCQSIAQLEAEREIRQLKDHCVMLEPMPNASEELVNETVTDAIDDLPLDPNASVFLVGGYDGVSWLSALDLYCPSRDVIKSLRPMSSVRSYSSVARLNGELYVFGGGDGYTWYDTVESYSPANDEWTLRPPLNQEKGSLAGATIDNKIFAIGGGNGVESFSDVEMLDLDIGRWISTRSMLQMRFALAAVELNGVLYATGGYDGNDYLNSAERFDPREH